MNPATLRVFDVFATERKNNINTDKVEKTQQYIPGQKMRKKYCKKDLFSIYTVSIFIYIFLQTPASCRPLCCLYNGLKYQKPSS